MRGILAALTLLFVVALPPVGPGAAAGAAEEPPLPAMPSEKGQQEEPAEEAGPPLPEMGGPAGETGPPLPETPGEGNGPPAPPLPPAEGEAAPEAEPGPETWSQALDRQLQGLPFPLHGFWETRIGPRYVEDNDHSRDFSLGETRLQLESNPFWRDVQFTFKADFVYDAVTREALVEVREANAAFSPLPFMDVEAGRQILTWGTGDLVFLNDLFPKDYVSFFIGRDVEYLKAPSDAVKVSLFSDPVNLDLVYTPHFDPDTFVTGKRLSYFNPLTGARAGEDTRLRTDEPESWFQDEELAARLYRSVGSYELAAYGYHGFWKSPRGIDPASRLFTHPELNAWGASVRGPFAAGIGNVEFSYYDSTDDRDGTDPFVPNSQLRFVAGYSQDMPRLMQDFTVGVQYYLERILDHEELEDALPPGFPEPDENRHVFTVRLTKLLLQQDMTVSLFTFWSPSDHDAYLRPYVSYDITDRWRIDGGANIFFGDDPHTQFSQFDRNSNVYLGLRYSF
ncbi:MAG: hypothetical protein ACOC7T_03470 [Planctomycetota bacterium]